MWDTFSNGFNMVKGEGERMVKGDHARNAGWAMLGMFILVIVIEILDYYFRK